MAFRGSRHAYNISHEIRRLLTLTFLLITAFFGQKQFYRLLTEQYHTDFCFCYIQQTINLHTIT